MSYISLFDRIEKEAPEYSSAFTLQKYDGTLKDVLLETESILMANKMNGEELTKLTLHPPRILKAILNYKIDNPQISELESLLDDATNLCLDIYRNSPTTLEQIYELTNKIEESEYSELLNTKLIQQIDQTTWDSTNPKKSKLSAPNVGTTHSVSNIKPYSSLPGSKSKTR